MIFCRNCSQTFNDESEKVEHIDDCPRCVTIKDARVEVVFGRFNTK